MLFRSQLNNSDMANRRKKVKKINKSRGLPADSPINVQMDARYDSYFIGSRHKFGQNASQALGIACEDQTDQHQIIGLYMQNKLCWTGAWLRGRGFNVKCPGGHADCTANIKQAEPLSEHELGYQIGLQLALQQVPIDNVTTDGDGRGAEGMQQALFKMLGPVAQVSRLADHVHLGQGQFRAAMKANFSSSMFPGCNKTKKNEVKKVFSLDVKARTHIVFTSLFKKYNGDVDKIGKKLPKIVDTIVACYGGDCAQCRYQVIGCNGGKRNCWWSKSYNFKAMNLKCGCLKMTKSDRKLLHEILAMKLSQEALKKLYLCTSTQKSESVNRAVSASLPKNTTYSKNAMARASSAVHRLNNGLSNSLHLKLESVGAPLPPGSRAAKAVKQMGDECKYQQTYRNLQQVKARKSAIQLHKAKEHFAYKSTVPHCDKSEYRKGQLDPLVKCASVKKVRKNKQK